MLRTTSRPHSDAQLDAARLWPPLAAVLLGVFLLYGVALAQPMALHNAAHDTRHSMAFPCH